MNLTAWGVEPFIRECADGRMIKKLSGASADYCNRVFCEAAEHECLEVVRTLLKDSRIDSYDTAIIKASSWGRTKMVELLLTDPHVSSAAINSSLCAAVSGGCTEIFNALMADPRVDPSANDNIAITRAIVYGRTEIARILLADPRVTPKRCDLTKVLDIELPETAALLLADPRIEPTTEDIQSAVRLMYHSGVTGSLMRMPSVAHKVGQWFHFGGGGLYAPTYLADMHVKAWARRRHILTCL